MEGLYKLDVYMKRSANLEGIFIADSEWIDYLMSSDLQVYFGEVAGKHSEIYGKLEPHEIKLVTQDQTIIALAREYGLCIGHNPFECCATYSSMGEEAEVFEGIEIGEIIKHKLAGTLPTTE